MGATWHIGPSPRQLTDEMVEVVRQLFLDQTGERYIPESVRSLPIPEWSGNLLLLDQNGMIRGLLWAAPFMENRVRIVAFAIDSEYRGKGYGSQAWDLLVLATKGIGRDELQLEVRGDNQFAINFYRKRGLEVVSDLEGYYQAGIGHVMRGCI